MFAFRPKECGQQDVDCVSGAVLPSTLGDVDIAVSAPADSDGDLVALLGPPADELEDGDTCEDAMGLPADGTVAIFGAMDGATDEVDHADPVCPAAGGGPDRVFGLFLQAPSHIRADVIATAFEPHLWLRTGQCDDGPLQECGSARGGWSILEADVEDGLVTLVVDSLSEDAAGDFLLVVTTTPAGQ